MDPPLYPPTVCVFFLHLLTKNYLILECLFCFQSISNRKILFGQIQTTNYLKNLTEIVDLSNVLTFAEE